MVIQVQPSSHGPHIWWPALMWNSDGFFTDFLRLKGTHVRAGRNIYYFIREAEQEAAERPT